MQGTGQVTKEQASGAVDHRRGIDLVAGIIGPDRVPRSTVKTIKIATFTAYVQAVHGRHQGRCNDTAAGGIAPLQRAVQIEGIDRTILRTKINVSPVIHRWRAVDPAAGFKGPQQGIQGSSALVGIAAV